jgi:hypothetical protein
MTKHHHPSGNNPDYVQMAHDLNDKILKITTEINDHNPELLKYLDEMPLTIPSEEDPEMNVQQLQSYYNSLVTLLKEYKDKNPNKEE